MTDIKQTISNAEKLMNKGMNVGVMGFCLYAAINAEIRQ